MKVFNDLKLLSLSLQVRRMLTDAYTCVCDLFLWVSFRNGLTTWIQSYTSANHTHTLTCRHTPFLINVYFLVWWGIHVETVLRPFITLLSSDVCSFMHSSHIYAMSWWWCIMGRLEDLSQFYFELPQEAKYFIQTCKHSDRKTCIFSSLTVLVSWHLYVICDDCNTYKQLIYGLAECVYTYTDTEVHLCEIKCQIIKMIYCVLDASR